MIFMGLIGSQIPVDIRHGIIVLNNMSHLFSSVDTAEINMVRLCDRIPFQFDLAQMNRLKQLQKICNFQIFVI